MRLIVEYLEWVRDWNVVRIDEDCERVSENGHERLAGDAIGHPWVTLTSTSIHAVAAFLYMHWMTRGSWCHQVCLSTITNQLSGSVRFRKWAYG